MNSKPIVRTPWIMAVVIVQSLIAWPLAHSFWYMATEWTTMSLVMGPLIWQTAALGLIELTLILLCCIGLWKLQPWGWTLAVLLDAALLAMHFLYQILSPHIPRLSAEFITAGALILLLSAPVRSRYMQERSLWLISWWQQPPDERRGFTKALAGIQLLFSIWLLFAALTVPYVGAKPGVLLYLLLGIATGLLLGLNVPYARAALLAWCMFYLGYVLFFHMGARPHRLVDGLFLFLVYYCYAVSLYLTVTIARAWIQRNNTAAQFAPKV